MQVLIVRFLCPFHADGRLVLGLSNGKTWALFRHRHLVAHLLLGQIKYQLFRIIIVVKIFAKDSCKEQTSTSVWATTEAEATAPSSRKLISPKMYNTSKKSKSRIKKQKIYHHYVFLQQSLFDFHRFLLESYKSPSQFGKCQKDETFLL